MHLIEPTFIDLPPCLSPARKAWGLAPLSDAISIYYSLILVLNLGKSLSEGKYTYAKEITMSCGKDADTGNEEPWAQARLITRSDPR